MKRWEITGLLATLIILMALPIYIFQQVNRPDPESLSRESTFVGSGKCESCHKKEYVEWQQSHHAKAMAVADETSVRADFNNTVFQKDGVETRFYRKDGKFFVHTPGPAGKMADFEITHTFGWFPLQQYLIQFPGGRMQCLPIAWDVRQKKWFHLYPDLVLDPEEWIYWTNQGQNWNSMCADCHSTALQKNYDPGTDSYQTQWAEINVGCEACHGAGSKHLAWAKLPEMARPTDANGLMVQTADIDNRQQVELCAPCHSRRSMLGDYTHLQQKLLDTEVPRLLEERLYSPDGQIKDEVYVYGSFVQSKMYANGVRCSDCHNVHTIKPHQEGNQLCLQCHQAAVYDTKEHHFHKTKDEKAEPIRSADGKILFAVGSGAECIGCHMPGRIYMGNDYRPDHSIRIPRPDLSLEIGTPNGCNRCHVDKDNAWSAEYTKKWYGSRKTYHFGSTFKAARDGSDSAADELIRIATDNLTPTLVRATALALLGRYRHQDVEQIFRMGLQNEEAIIRRTALLYLPRFSPEKIAEFVAPLLDDPVKGVRIEAARALTALPIEQIPDGYSKPFARALGEFKETALYSADFAASRLNLGTLAMHQGDIQAAEKHFKKAVEIDRDFYTARTNLAVLYSRQGNNDLAEEQLRAALANNSDLADVNYSLGLLLSEQKKYDEAVEHLAVAAAAMPENARIHYNLGQLLAFLGQDKEAERILLYTAELAPDNMQYLQALAQFYLNRRKYQQAEEVGQMMLSNAPDNPLGRQLLDYIQEQTR